MNFIGELRLTGHRSKPFSQLSNQGESREAVNPVEHRNINNRDFN